MKSIAMGLSLAVGFVGAEREIPLSEVPPAVLEAVRKAVPGVSLQEAEIETEDVRTTQELEGELGEVDVEIEVSEDGEVLDVERSDSRTDSDRDDGPGKER